MPNPFLVLFLSLAFYAGGTIAGSWIRHVYGEEGMVHRWPLPWVVTFGCLLAAVAVRYA